MNRYAHFLILFAMAAFTMGCYSELNVHKVPRENSITTGKANGYYYSLPIPYVVVKPKGDGTMDVAVEYLPDPDHQYAVNGWTFFGNQTITVEVEDNGLLKKIVWDADDTAVAAQLAGSAGVVGAAKITAEGEAKKEEASKLETLAKEQALKLNDARKAYDEAETNYKIALEEVAFLEQAIKKDSTLKSDLFSANKKLREAEIRRNAAKENLERLEAPRTFQASDFSSDPLVGEIQQLQKEIDSFQLQVKTVSREVKELGLANKPNEQLSTKQRELDEREQILKNKRSELKTKAAQLNDKDKRKFSSAWGSVWFEIQDQPNAAPPTLKLVAMEPQQKVPTGGPPEKLSGIEPPDLKLSLTKPSPGVIDLGPNDLVKLEIESNRDIWVAPTPKNSAELFRLTEVNGVPKSIDITDDLKLITLVGKRTLVVDIARTTTSGIYSLKLNLNLGTKDKPDIKPSEILIVLDRRSA